MMKFIKMLFANKYNPEKMSYTFYTKKKMPCCGSRKFKEGPSAFPAINIICAKCGSRFNVCSPMKYIAKL